MKTWTTMPVRVMFSGRRQLPRSRICAAAPWTWSDRNDNLENDNVGLRSERNEKLEHENVGLRFGAMRQGKHAIWGYLGAESQGRWRGDLGAIAELDVTAEAVDGDGRYARQGEEGGDL